MRFARGLAGAVLLAALAGCSAEPLRPLASQAGRACQAVEYDAVQAALGVRFDVADSAQVAESYSCVLSQTGRAYPELQVTLTGSPADELIFQTAATPAGSAVVENLGRRAYQARLDPSGEAGPAVEVGWLSAAPQIMTLRYTWATDATEEQVTALSPALVELARGIEALILGTVPTTAPATPTP